MVIFVPLIVACALVPYAVRRLAPIGWAGFGPVSILHQLGTTVTREKADEPTAGALAVADEPPMAAAGVGPDRRVEGRTTTAPGENGNGKTIIGFSLVFFLFIVLKNAWMSDDAYITFRVVDNFVHGYGLTWNPDERVQAYTHPLWMFLISPIYAVSHEIYFSSLLLSITASLLAAGLFAFYVARSLLLGALGILTLAASKSFVNFSTSGLENPLSHLLIVAFVLVFYRGRVQKRHLFRLALIAGLAALNRVDSLLLYAPALLYAFYKVPGWSSVKAIVLGFSPFLCWEIFSLWYYGFPFPNTAYAKLNTGAGNGQLLKQGVGYFISSFNFDPILFLIIAGSITVILLQKEWKSLPFVIGMALYLFYTVKIGGDFMAGRFLTEPYLIAVILLARSVSLAPLSLGWNWLPALTVIVVAAVLVPNSSWYTVNKDNTVVDIRGVADERAYYFNGIGVNDMGVSGTGILNFQRSGLWPNWPWGALGVQVRQSHQRVVMGYGIGFFGFEAGPHVHIVDAFALADPLLARLPAQPGWRIGHFMRAVPVGYLDTLRSGKNVIRNRNLALYYSKLQSVTRGPLFDLGRLVEIVKFNTGAYNHLLKGVGYVCKVPPGAIDCEV